MISSRSWANTAGMRSQPTLFFDNTTQCSKSNRGFLEGPPELGSEDIDNANATEAQEPRTPMPLLSPPTEAAVCIDHSSYETGADKDGEKIISSENIVAQIKTELSITALTQHYATQWEKAGWSPFSNSDEVNDGTVSRFWNLKDEAGRSWYGVLMIVPEANFRPGRIANRPDRYFASASVVLLKESQITPQN